MAARPQVGTYKADGTTSSQTVMPSVFLAPIRTDIVHFVHTQMAKNKRQAYGVRYGGSGHQTAGMGHSAHSWGTGRAVSRIPRVSGGGTSRAGQAAFGNMCRKGRMFAPTRVWRKWHRKINTNQKRYAVVSALAASALPSLVMARGHVVNAVPEIPLVVDTAAESMTKTKAAIAALKAVGAYADIEKSKDSWHIRTGKGKMRNRRHVQRRGPLVVYNEDNGIVKAFRNLPGVDLCQVDQLNLLQLAPGGHMGRLIVWTAGAFSKLNSVFGTTKRTSDSKKGYTLPRNIMTNSDVTRLINSQEVQSVVRPVKKSFQRARLKKNPLTNLGAKVRLNPYALRLRRAELLNQQHRKENKAATLAKKRAQRKAHPNKTKAANFARISRDE